MDKISCNIIQDLLPVYAAKEASEDTMHLVGEHLKECKVCQAELEKLHSAIVVPVDTEENIIKKIKKKRRKKLIIKFSCLIVALLILFQIFYSIYHDMTMTLDASDLSAQVDEDGDVILIPSERAKNMLISRIYTQDENGNTTVYLSLKKSSDFGIFFADPLGWFINSYDNVTQKVPIDVYEISRDQLGNYHFNFATSPNAGSDEVAVLYGDNIVLGDSITKVYYQPGIENETSSFYEYMSDLCDKANKEANNIKEARKIFLSKYDVPESSERVLIYSKE